jgi:aspartyl-tRNA(Asn)/glutamyl-tRNA(Gln) amidotransferase subunit B
LGSIPLKQETRQFDEVKGETYSLRSKEEAEDYRYMPDANLPAMVFEQVSFENASFSDSKGAE